MGNISCSLEKYDTTDPNVPQGNVTSRHHILVYGVYGHVIIVYIAILLITRQSSKHEALAQCWADAGPLSTTLAQHQLNIGPTVNP